MLQCGVAVVLAVLVAMATTLVTVVLVVLVAMCVSMVVARLSGTVVVTVVANYHVVWETHQLVGARSCVAGPFVRSHGIGQWPAGVSRRPPKSLLCILRERMQGTPRTESLPRIPLAQWRLAVHAEKAVARPASVGLAAVFASPPA